MSRASSAASSCWCQPNRQGIAKLDAFFDTNERKYFITLQSVTATIGEEQAKQTASGKTPDAPSFYEVRQGAETSSRTATEDGASEQQRELEMKLRDLEITNRVKDQVIGMMEKERDRLINEHQSRVRELMTQSYRIGQLETQLLQLGAPAAAFHEGS